MRSVYAAEQEESIGIVRQFTSCIDNGAVQLYIQYRLAPSLPRAVHVLWIDPLMTLERTMQHNPFSPTLWRRLVLTVVTLLALAFLAPQHAVFAQSPDPASCPEWAAQYALYAGVSCEEAVRRLDLQMPTGELGVKIGASEPNFAGSWLVHTPVFGLRVALAQPDAEAVVASYLDDVPFRDEVRGVVAHYTLKQLHAINDLVFDAVPTMTIDHSLITGMGLDIIQQRVRFYTSDEATLRAQLAEQPLFRDGVVSMDDIGFTYQQYPEAPAAQTAPTYTVRLPIFRLAPQ